MLAVTLTFLHLSLGLFVPKVGTAAGHGTGERTFETVFSIVHTGHLRVFTVWGDCSDNARVRGVHWDAAAFWGVCRALVPHDNAHECTLVR